MNNKKALEIYSEITKTNVPLKQIGQYFPVLENEAVNRDALIRKLRRTKETMMKKKGKYREQYETEKFIIPVQTVSKESYKPPKFEVFETEAANLAMASLQEEHTTALSEKESTYEEKIKILESKHKKEVDKTKLDSIKARKEMTEWKKKSQYLRNENLLLKRKRKRDESKIILAKKYPKLSKEYENLSQEQMKMREEIRTLTSENETLTHLLKEVKDVETENVEIVEGTQENITLQSRVKELETERDYLLQMLDDDTGLNLLDEERGVYTTQLRECVMALTNLNVPTNSVSPVIETVLKLANKTADKLPSRHTIENIVHEKVVVGQKQVGSCLKSKGNICLYGDETRKKGKTYQTFLVSDEEKNVYFLGLRDMHNKAASTTLETFKEILNDISNACEEMVSDGETPQGLNILSNICSFMSDRAKVNLAFTELLEQYKTDILSQIMEGWKDLTESQKLLCSRVNNFFCALHLLVNMAECAGPILKKFEKMHELSEDTEEVDTEETEDASYSIQRNEAMTLTLLRFCSKCFSCGGDEKCGAHADFRAFCNSIQEKVLFVPFRGNRFNIIFLIAQYVFYHKDNIQKFLREVHGADNFLQKVILSYIVKPLLLASCKVLGLISKLITAPFWRIIERSVHIFDLNTYFHSLSSYLLRQSQDATGFVGGEEFPFEEELLEKDQLFRQLVKPDETIDSLAIQLSQMLFCGFHKLISNALKEHLPGGTYSDPSDTLRERSKAVIPHNIMSERVFGMLDRFLTLRPNASTLTNEASVMFTLNKTSEWLESLSDEEKESILKGSIKEGREFRKAFKNRCNIISEKRKETLLEKKKALERKLQNLKIQREKQTTDIIYYGLWQSVERMDSALEEIKSIPEKRKALEAQLRFREKMLKQSFPEKDVFRFSVKGKKHAVSKLKENLTKLIEAAYKGPRTEKLHRKAPLLVGKRVKHHFEEGVYLGQVISVVPGFVDFYNIVYDKDVAQDGVTQCVYTYKLLEDYRKGDLEIVLQSGVSSEKDSH